MILLYKKELGISLPSVMLGLLVASVVSAGVVQKITYEKNVDKGTELAKRIKPIALASNEYVADNYSTLQNSKQVTINGYTPLKPFEPTVDDLVSMRYLPLGFNEQVPFGSGEVRIKLTKEPAGCISEKCEIPGMVYVNKPAHGKNNEQNAILLGAYMKEVGPDALISTNVNKNIIVNRHGFSTPNPVSGSPVGVYGISVGWGTGTFRNYLTLNDTRDPNFRGDLTVKGNIKSESNITGENIIANETIGVGNGNNNACNLAEILKSGQFISRSANCVKRIVLDPVDSSITANYSDGRKSIAIIGDSGTISIANKATNSETIQMNGNNSSVSISSSDKRKNTIIDGNNGRIESSDASGNAVVINSSSGISLSGNGVSNIGSFYQDGVKSRLTTTVENLTGKFSPGSDCSKFNSGDISNSNNNDGLVICTKNVWRLITTITSEANSNCSKEGSTSIDPNGATLICSSGKWVSLLDRIGKAAFMGSYLVSNGSVVQKPYCLNGSIGSTIYVIPQAISTDMYRANYRAQDMGSQWKISITDGIGNQISGNAIATSYCIYGEI